MHTIANVCYLFSHLQSYLSQTDKKIEELEHVLEAKLQKEIFVSVLLCYSACHHFNAVLRCTVLIFFFFIFFLRKYSVILMLQLVELNIIKRNRKTPQIKIKREFVMKNNIRGRLSQHLCCIHRTALAQLIRNLNFLSVLRGLGW